MGAPMPELVDLGSMRNQAEQAMVSSPESRIFHGLCINSFQLPVPDAFLFWMSSVVGNGCGSISQIKSFLPKLLLLLVFFFTTTVNQTKTSFFVLNFIVLFLAKRTLTSRLPWTLCIRHNIYVFSFLSVERVEAEWLNLHIIV